MTMEQPIPTQNFPRKVSFLPFSITGNTGVAARRIVVTGANWADESATAAISSYMLRNANTNNTDRGYFTFRGSYLYLLTETGGYGIVEFDVTDSKLGTKTYSIDCYKAQSITQDMLLIAEGLTDEIHTVTIKTTNTKNGASADKLLRMHGVLVDGSENPQYGFEQSNLIIFLLQGGGVKLGTSGATIGSIASIVSALPVGYNIIGKITSFTTGAVAMLNAVAVAGGAEQLENAREIQTNPTRQTLYLVVVTLAAGVTVLNIEVTPRTAVAAAGGVGYDNETDRLVLNKSGLTAAGTYRFSFYTDGSMSEMGVRVKNLDANTVTVTVTAYS